MVEYARFKIWKQKFITLSFRPSIMWREIMIYLSQNYAWYIAVSADQLIFINRVQFVEEKTTVSRQGTKPGRGWKFDWLAEELSGRNSELSAELLMVKPRIWIYDLRGFVPSVPLEATVLTIFRWEYFSLGFRRRINTEIRRDPCSLFHA